MANEPTSSNHSCAVTFYEPHPDAHPVKSALKKHPVLIPSSLSGDLSVLSDNDNGSGDEGDDEGEVKGRSNKEEGDHSVRGKKSLKWDEDAIGEHDQLRGTRMKIDEPDTPYAHYDSHEEDGGSASSTTKLGHPRTPPHDEDHQKPSANLALHWDHIKNKLNTVAAVRDYYPSSPSTSSHDGGGGYASASSLAHSDSEDVVEKRRNRRADQEFKMHRKMHYNEMEELRKWKAQHDHESDNEDEDEDGVEVNNNNGKKIRTIT